MAKARRSIEYSANPIQLGMDSQGSGVTLILTQQEADWLCAGLRDHKDAHIAAHELGNANDAIITNSLLDALLPVTAPVDLGY